MSEQKIRVLIADDQRLMREGLRFSKLGARDRSQVIIKARQLGLA